MLILLNKPFSVLCQFSDTNHRQTLANYVAVQDVYPAGRLDQDSEGLVILTDDGTLQHKISHPRHKLAKTYWVQVEGIPHEEALDQLRQGVRLKDGQTAPASVKKISEPHVWPRNPPIRFRANIPTTWLEMTIYEGRNRQVRRMTAAVGFPTLRLIRIQIGPWKLGNLAPGEWSEAKIPDNWRTIDRHEMVASGHSSRSHRKRRPVPRRGRSTRPGNRH